MHPRIASYGVLLAVAFAMAGEARAAFIAPDPGSYLSNDTSSSATEGSSSSRIKEETPGRPGASGSQFYTRTGRGMTSNSTSVPVGAGAAGTALPVTEAQLTGGRLVTRWEREGGCELPEPHLEGVFRPPREGES